MGVTVMAWRLGPRWASLSLAADGSSLTLHSTHRHEVVDIERPVELCLYDTTTHGHDEVTGDGHRRDDPTTRWINSGLYVGRGWRAVLAMVGLVLGFLVVWPLTVSAIATVATEPEGPSVVSAEAVEQQLVATTDDLATDLRLDEPSAVDDPTTQVVAAPCNRDQHEWFWGPVGASRLDVTASTELHGVRIDRLTQQLL